MRGVYAHINKLNGKVFYVGQQKIHNNRAYDFKNRSDKWKEYVSKISQNNIVVEFLYITDDDNINLYPIESKFQHFFYHRDSEMTTHELIHYGELNSNFGNKWTDKMKKDLSEKRKRNGKSKGENNPMFGIPLRDRVTEEGYAIMKERMSRSATGSGNSRATKCTLHSPSGDIYKFEYLKQMDEWIADNITRGQVIRPPENTPWYKKEVKGSNKFRLSGWYFVKGW